MRNTTQKAFTLIELMIVISIIAILAAILIPTINAIKKRGEAEKAAKAQPQRFTMTRTLINCEPSGSGFIITVRDTLTGKEYISVPDTMLVEVTRSATSAMVCEAPLSKGQ